MQFAGRSIFRFINYHPSFSRWNSKDWSNVLRGIFIVQHKIKSEVGSRKSEGKNQKHLEQCFYFGLRSSDFGPKNIIIKYNDAKTTGSITFNHISHYYVSLHTSRQQTEINTGCSGYLFCSGKCTSGFHVWNSHRFIRPGFG